MIDVVWHNAAKGNWDSGLLSEIFDAHPDVFVQSNTEMPKVFDRAIVVVVGKPDAAPLRKYLESLREALVLLTSDEDAYFPWEYAVPNHCKIWTQYYNEEYKLGIRERFLLGPPNRLKDYKINRTLEKKYLWSFVGQVQNPARQACVAALEKLGGGYMQICELFGGNGNGAVEYQDYLDIMCQSKFVICPSGSMSVDSFRLYEAIECGAIPITERRSPRDPQHFNYWDEVYPPHTIWTVNEWDDMLAENFFDFYSENHVRKMNLWWTKYKRDLTHHLLAYATC